jgi:hypothetical protein
MKKKAKQTKQVLVNVSNKQKEQLKQIASYYNMNVSELFRAIGDKELKVTR